MKNIPTLHDAQQHILITGGTGFIGQPLCELLVSQGHHVTILTRTIEKAKKRFHSDLISFTDNLEQLSPDIHFDAVINLAGEVVAQRWTEDTKRKIIESREHITQDVIQFIQHTHTPPTTVIHASAIGVYGLSESTVFTEESKLKPTPQSFCETICFARESSLSAIEHLPIRLCTIRIGLVMERGGGVLGELERPYSFGLGGTVGSGTQWMSWIHREDIIRIIYYLLNEQTAQGIYNATAPFPVTQRDFSRALGKALHRPTCIHMPSMMVKMLFGEMGEELLLSGQNVIPTRLEEDGFTFSFPKLDDAFCDIFSHKTH